MDFVEGLPKSNSYDVLLVVIDRFSKYAHFIPLAHPYTLIQVAQAYMNNVYKLHGLPESIVSDRDKVFTGKVWQELFRLSDTQLQMCFACHPQSYGQTERLNQCVEAFLRCTVHSCPKSWSKWIARAEHGYNTSFQSAVGGCALYPKFLYLSPFLVVVIRDHNIHVEGRALAPGNS